MTVKVIVGYWFVAMLAACVTVWCMNFQKILRRQPLVAAVSRVPAPWNVLDVCCSIVFFIAVQIVAMLVTRHFMGVASDTRLEDFTSHQVAVQLLAGALAQSLAALVIGAYLRWVRGVHAEELGFSAGWFLSDMGLGILAFLQLIGPVLVIQSILTLWWPSQHPIIDLLKKSDSQIAWIASIVAAVVVAPIVEEFLFRVVIQGWFERIALSISPSSGKAVDRGTITGTEETASDPINAATQFATADAGPYKSPTTATNSSANSAIEKRKLAWWPIFASAAIFALMHAGHGPDMIALFILACGLGYLYRQTHRIIPCIVVHFLLNAWSMIALFSLVRSD